jgi:glycosyltransferase involved in cell wall biosynthesis
MNNPLVSICSASYNHEPYLDTFFQSILDQTYPNIKLILTDDCSTDGSRDKIHKWLEILIKKGIKWNYHYNGKNFGGFKTFSEIFKRASGEYLCILETDDYLKPESIEKRVRFLQENRQYTSVHTDIDYLYEDGRVHPNFWTSVNRGIPSPTSFEYLMKENSIMSCSYMMETQSFKFSPDWIEYENRGYKMADFPMFLWTAQRYLIGYLPESLSVYRVLGNSASHKPESRAAFIESTEKIKKDAREGRL